MTTPTVTQMRILIVWSCLASVCVAAADQSLSDRIAKAVGAPTVQPPKVKPASEVVRFRANLGVYNSQA